MPSSTATWAIPYPDGTDAFCDGYLFIQDMAERVDEILDEFDVSLDETEVLPLARISRTTSESLATGELLTFDTINFDTANLSLQASFGLLTAPAETYYLTGATSFFRNIGATAGDTSSLYVDATDGSVFTWTQRDPATSAGSLASFAGLHRNTAATADQMTLQYGGSGTFTSITVFTAYFWILKTGAV